MDGDTSFGDPQETSCPELDSCQNSGCLEERRVVCGGARDAGAPPVPKPPIADANIERSVAARSYSTRHSSVSHSGSSTLTAKLLDDSPVFHPEPP